MTLLLTAQSAATIKPAVIKQTLDVGNGANVVGRSRRDRLSQNIETPKEGKSPPYEKAPPRKRAKRESHGVVAHCE